MKLIAEDVVSKSSWIWPPTRSVSACAEPLYGTCTIFVPVARLNASHARCCVLPMPEEPHEKAPGFALITAMSSFTLVAGTVGRDHDDVRHDHDERDRREVLDRVEAELHEVRRDRLRGVGGDEQRVAVGRRLRGHVGGDRVRRAGPVLDHERLAEDRAQTCRRACAR